MLLIVDGNNVAWAGLFGIGRAAGMETEEQKIRATLIGLTQSIVGLVTRGGEAPDAPVRPGRVTALAVAFDHGRPLRRREAYPAYQTGREATPSFVDNEPAVLAAIDQFVGGALMLPCTILRGTNTEADDLAAAAALQAPGEVRIASTDRDFLQLIDARISVYSTVKRVVVTPANFTEQACPRASDGTPATFPRERYLEYRLASGDTSDDLPGIPGVGALTAARLVAKHPLDAYLDDVGLTTAVLGRRNVRIEGAIRSGEARRVVDRNRQLMDLRRAAAGYDDIGPYTVFGRWNETGFRAWLAANRLANLDTVAMRDAFAAIDRAR